MLVVSGKVVTSTGGFQVAFDRFMQIRESHPAQAFVTLLVADPEGAPVTQAQVTHGVRGMAAEPAGRKRGRALRRQNARRNNAHPNRILNYTR